MNAFSVRLTEATQGLKEVAYDIIDLEKNMCKKMVENMG